jgi:hypothetical protein
VSSDTSITLTSPFMLETRHRRRPMSISRTNTTSTPISCARWTRSSSTTNQQMGIIGSSDRTRFRREYPATAVTGKPVGRVHRGPRLRVGNTTPIRRVAAFGAAGCVNYSIPYSFVTNKLAVTSAGVALESLVRRRRRAHRPAAISHAITFMPSTTGIGTRRTTSARAEAVKSEFVDLMIRITGDTEIGERRPVIAAVHADQLSRPRPLALFGHGNVGHATTGSRFDRMEDY